MVPTHDRDSSGPDRSVAYTTKLRREESVAMTATKAPVGPVAAPSTVPRVARHLDRQRLLRPRDYAADPRQFGVDPDVPFRVPTGGDRASMHSAIEQHLLLCAWNQSRRPSATALGRRFGVSKQTISRVNRGERWAGHTVLAALVYAARGHTLPDGSVRPSDAERRR